MSEQQQTPASGGARAPETYDARLVLEARLADLESQVRRLTDAFRLLGDAHAVASGSSSGGYRGHGRGGGRGRGGFR